MAPEFISVGDNSHEASVEEVSPYIVQGGDLCPEKKRADQSSEPSEPSETVHDNQAVGGQ